MQRNRFAFAVDPARRLVPESTQRTAWPQLEPQKLRSPSTVTHLSKHTFLHHVKHHHTFAPDPQSFAWWPHREYARTVPDKLLSASQLFGSFGMMHTLACEDPRCVDWEIRETSLSE